MTGRTHDLAAFTALNIAFIATQPPQISLATLVFSGFSNMLGGLFPDIDNASSTFWNKFRGGRVISAVISPLLGGHRMISHSLVGAALAAFLAREILFAIDHIILIDMHIVWLSFAIGIASHLITDALTKEGIPLLFPIPIRLGFPPFELLRIKTGGKIEKALIFPSMILLNGYLLYAFKSHYLDFLSALIQTS